MSGHRTTFERRQVYAQDQGRDRGVGSGSVGGRRRAGAGHQSPLTKIEIFEARTGTVIVRGSVLIDTMSAQNGTVSVRAKESLEPGSGRKVYGIAVDLTEDGRPHDTTMVDYEELGSFLNAIESISKANHSMTSLPDYDVGYTTTGWLRLVVYTSAKRPGTTQIALQSRHRTGTSYYFRRTSWPTFQNLIQQAKDEAGFVAEREVGGWLLAEFKLRRDFGFEDIHYGA